METGADRRDRWGDALVAAALAALLAAAWAWRDWHQLSALRLPDTDDMMRLQQIRDWLAGQRFSDLSQHRLGVAPGLAMHWSRLADLVPAALIALLTPMMGQSGAELVAVILWPAALFAVALFLVARIARTVGGAPIARTAAVVAALAYPATTIFLPGRIDHHGLQIVLLLLIARTLVAMPRMAVGLAAGVAATASIVIGMETAPLIAAAGLAMTGEWLRARPGADDRMMGFGIGLGAGLLAASIVFHTDQWVYPGCDGFTATAWRAAVTAAFAPMALALAARDVTRPAKRAVLGVIICTLIGAGIVTMAPECLTPYGMVDPLLARFWLGRIGEAQPLFEVAPGVAIGYAGVMVAGIAATAWRLHATSDRRWGALLVLQIAAFALTLVQLRGAYTGAILAAPALAAVIAGARARSAGWLAVVWIGSAGMLYQIAANAVVVHPTRSTANDVAGTCTSPEVLATLRTLPSGRLLAPLDLGAYAIGGTGLSVIGAPYHRNNAGNLAVYRFFLGTPGEARSIARAWQVSYVAICADSFVDLATAQSFATALHRDRHPPDWLRPVSAASGVSLYIVAPGLSARTPAR